MKTPTYIQEYDALLTNAENIIFELLNELETNAPEHYSQSDNVLKADKWISWLNGELMDNEIKEFFNFKML